jgi:hypothetical protein
MHQSVVLCVCVSRTCSRAFALFVNTQRLMAALTAPAVSMCVLYKSQNPLAAHHSVVFWDNVAVAVSFYSHPRPPCITPLTLAIVTM